MKSLNLPLISIASVALIAAAYFGFKKKDAANETSHADVIYQGGPILTMAGKEPAYVDVLAVKDGKIVFAGTQGDASGWKGPSTLVKDLGGKTLLPGFIDAHSHFINALSVSGQANCYAAPFGPGATKEGIIGSLKKLKEDQKIGAGEIIMGYGYDDSIFPEGGKLTAADLDPVSVGQDAAVDFQLNDAEQFGAERRLGILKAKGRPPQAGRQPFL